MAHSDFFVGIGATGVRLFDARSHKEWKTEYPAGMVDNLEVKDAETYKKWWTEIITKLGIHGKNVLIVLEESTVFYKHIKQEDEGEAFWKEVPLLPEHILKNIITVPAGLTAIAVNMQLHETAIAVLKEVKSAITGIYPEIILPTRIPGEIMKLGNLPEEGNFLKQYTSPEEDKKTRSGKQKTAMLAGAGVILVAAAVLVTVLLIQKEEKTEVKQVTPAVPAVSEIRATPTEAPVTPEALPEVDLKTVSILVLNDSGVSGKAGEISQFLKDHGYVNVETGNSSAHKYSGLLIKVGSNKALAEKLFADLSGTFNPATPEMQWQENPGKDAVIIIGK